MTKIDIFSVVKENDVIYMAKKILKTWHQCKLETWKHDFFFFLTEKEQKLKTNAQMSSHI